MLKLCNTGKVSKCTQTQTYTFTNYIFLFLFNFFVGEGGAEENNLELIVLVFFLVKSGYLLFVFTSM